MAAVVDGPRASTTRMLALADGPRPSGEHKSYHQNDSSGLWSQGLWYQCGTILIPQTPILIS